MSGAGRRRFGKVVGIALGMLAIVAGAVVLVYQDGNLHAEERAIARALSSGFVQTRAPDAS